MGFRGNLWLHRDFLKFWIGDTISQSTGQVSRLALAKVAVLTLQVTGFQLGILNALGFTAFPLLGARGVAIITDPQAEYARG